MITRVLSTYLIFFSVGHSLSLLARHPLSAVGLGKIVVAFVGRAGGASSYEAEPSQSIDAWVFISSVLDVNKNLELRNQVKFAHS